MEPSPALFNALIAKYRSALIEFDAKVKAIESGYINENMKVTGTNDLLNPWLTAFQQTTTFRPEIAAACAGPEIPLTVPAGVAEHVPEFYAIAARMFPGDRISVTVDDVR